MRTQTGEWLDFGLILLAAAFLAFVGVSGVGHELYASADRVTEGKLWLLLTSALNIEEEYELVQWALLAFVTTAVIYRLGPRIWWSTTLSAHVLSAVISYTVIEIAIALGSSSAAAEARESDYGISIFIAASLGALAASGLIAYRAKPAGMGTSDRLAFGLGLLGLPVILAVSLGWYDIQHLIGYAIGFLLTICMVKRKLFGVADDSRFEKLR